MHNQIQNVTGEGFIVDQFGDIEVHINNHLDQLEGLGVPEDALNELRRLIEWWF